MADAVCNTYCGEPNPKHDSVSVKKPQTSVEFFFFFPRNSGGTSKHGLPFQAKLSCAFSDIMTLQFHACFSSVKEKKSAMEFYFSTQGSNLVSLSTCSPMFFLRRKSVGTFHKKKKDTAPAYCQKCFGVQYVFPKFM